MGLCWVFFVTGLIKECCFTAVQNNGSQDEEAPSPAKRIKQKLTERSQSEKNSWTSCHGEPVSQRPFHLEIGTYMIVGAAKVEIFS